MTPEQIKMQTPYNSVQIDHILQSNERKMPVISVFFFSTTMSTTKMIKDCLHALQTTSKLPEIIRKNTRSQDFLGIIECEGIRNAVKGQLESVAKDRISNIFVLGNDVLR